MLDSYFIDNTTASCYNLIKKAGEKMDDVQIVLHIIELCLFIISSFWVLWRNSRFIQKQPFKTLALISIFTTLFGAIALCIYDVILFFIEL